MSETSNCIVIENEEQTNLDGLINNNNNSNLNLESQYFK